ncbi:MAG: cysteine hydrolase [Terriglobia bacterium]|nr:MAG: cysteine hydrolase [Terriglobia bacterium]
MDSGYVAGLGHADRSQGRRHHYRRSGGFDCTSQEAGVAIGLAPALLLIDLQKAIDDPYWAREGPRNNPDAERAALQLLTAWRETGRPVYHVRHDSAEPQSTYRPGQPGNEFKSGFEPRPGEDLIVKHTGSAFVGTPLEQMLRRRGLASLVVAGVITNNSVETSVRHAATLGFRVTLVEDACFTFARRDWNGVLRSAAEVHAMSLANLEGEYCRVATAAEILSGRLELGV